MGRYIDGDISHKFWFGTQSSDAASQFGGEMENCYIPYYYEDMSEFDVELLEELIEELNEKYDESITLETDPEYLYGYNHPNEKEWWEKVNDDRLVADVQLGLRIYQHIKEHGSCEFQAEL